jgi:hypothetical protein
VPLHEGVERTALSCAEAFEEFLVRRWDCGRCWHGEDSKETDLAEHSLALGAEQSLL